MNWQNATVLVTGGTGSFGRKFTEILAGCPAIDRLLTAAPPEAAKRSLLNLSQDFRLAMELRRRRFDYAFELSDGDRGRLLVALSRARRRCAGDGVHRIPWFLRTQFNCLSKHDWRHEHQVEAGYNLVNEFLPLSLKEPPSLVFDRARTAPCDLGVKLSDYVMIHPGTRWQRKRWPVEKWIETGRELLRLVPQLVISVGPDAEEVQLGDTIANALGPQAISTRGQLSWAQLAGLLYGAKLFVGVDTAAMHLAAACQCPTVALFGPSDGRIWRPWQVRHELVSPPGDAPHERRMDDITAEQVLVACRRLQP